MLRLEILATVLVGAVVFSGCNVNLPSQATSADTTAKTDAVPTKLPEPPTSPWQVSMSHNELTGEIQLTAINGIRDHAIIVRKRGKKLDCYVTTGEFLETVDNMHSRRSMIKYKYDDGPIVSQAWIISDDNTALFYPANPKPFLQKMRNAKRFVIEYSPSEKVPQTESFDLSPFPLELADLLDKAGAL